MKAFMIFLQITIFCISNTFAQSQIKGKVLSKIDHKPLVGASVAIKGTNFKTYSNNSGEFNLTISNTNVTIQVYFVGYVTQELEIKNRDSVSHIFVLERESRLLDEVNISTGYQKISREMATGSFTVIDNKLFNRTVSSDVISRLEGLTSSLHFDRRGVTNSIKNTELNLRIRGESSIKSNTSPLIVLDNFPYQGNLNSINPNDVESITVLKDASAASIWGAQAGNGVIVITSKRGKFKEHPILNLTTNLSSISMPDLSYNPNFLDASSFIQLEQLLFNNGFYNNLESNLNKPVISPAVEILIKHRDKLIDDKQFNSELEYLRNQDVRNDLEKYYYRRSFKQQYSLDIRGGAEKMNYYISSGYDKNLASTQNDLNDRFTITASDTYRPVKYLELSADINFAQQNFKNSGGIPPVIGQFPYNRIVDENGIPLPILNLYRQNYAENAESLGLLNWQFFPLNELSLNSNKSNSLQTRINAGLKLIPFNDLSLEVKYQYQREIGDSRKIDDKNSFYVRNLVNRFTQTDGNKVFPYEGILTSSRNENVSQSVRGQVNYNKNISNRHELNSLVGLEIRQIHSNDDGYQLYGYDDDILTYQSLFNYNTNYPVRPRGSARIPLPSVGLKDYLDRYISYFGNASYVYDKTYIISGSVRWDASNLFGVSINQKWTPLWSSGLSWIISNEGFYPFSAIPYLKIRSTYGYNGNINKSVTAFVTTRTFIDDLTDLRYAIVRSPGDPNLRWEKVGIFNLGVDFRTNMNWLSGSIEYYNKSGKDLLGENQLDLTTGYRTTPSSTNLSNYASTITNGIDVELNSVIINKSLRWESNLLVSYVKNKVMSYNFTPTISSGLLSNSAIPSLARVGKSLDDLYSFTWYGLDATTGDPLVKVGNELNKDYVNYIANITENDLVSKGSSVPTSFGSLRNTFTWMNVSVSANILWKMGYYFRRSSINYSNFINRWVGHRDFDQRWKKPGDELKTQVPSIPSTNNSSRDVVYNFSELLIEKGDHIRLQDIQISYSLTKNATRNLPVNNLNIYVYLQNPAIIWRANKENLDPDYPSASYPSLKSFSIGLKAKF